MSKVSDFPIATGGLMRCCIETLNRMANEPCHPGQEVHCQWCKSTGGGMVLAGGCWKWKGSLQ